MRDAIAYVRVSTAKQGRSGLGLEAQEAALRKFAEAEGFHFLQTFTETESGADEARTEPPGLRRIDSGPEEGRPWLSLSFAKPRSSDLATCSANWSTRPRPATSTAVRTMPKCHLSTSARARSTSKPAAPAPIMGSGIRSHGVVNPT
jgi:hypothetical protein